MLEIEREREQGKETYLWEREDLRSVVWEKGFRRSERHRGEGKTRAWKTTFIQVRWLDGRSYP